MEKWVVRPLDWQEICRSAWYVVIKKPVEWRCLRPMPVLAISAATGIWIAAATLQPFFLIMVLLLIFIAACRLTIRPRWLKWMTPAVFIGSALHVILIIAPAQSQSVRLAGEMFTLQGRVCSMPVSSGSSGHMIIRQTDGVKIMLFYLDTGLDIHYGDLISVSARASLPVGRRNPGGFDEAGWLSSQGIYLKAWPLARGSILVTGRGSLPELMQIGADCRKSLTSLFRRILNEQQAALLSGLLLGDTSLISDEITSDFRRSGLAHLMSVSGANVSYFLLPAGKLLKKSKISRRKRIGFLLVLLCAFGFLTGWQASVTRAILMACCVLVGSLLRRPADAISSLSAAACLMMLVQPMTALSAGFWLSLSATASLILFSGALAQRICHGIPILPLPLAEAIAVPVCVQMVLLPLLATTGNEISLISLLSNLLAGPLTGGINAVAALVMPLAVIIDLPVFANIQFWALAATGRPLGLGLDLLSQLAAIAGQIQCGRFAAGGLGPAFWLAWFLIATVWAWKSCMASSEQNCLFRLASRLRLPAVGAWILIFLAGMLTAPPVQVWIFDVGQGDAMLILARSGESVLIDGGCPGKGNDVLLPALDALGVRRVTLAISTHGHADHVGGLIDVIQAGRVRQLAVSADEANAANIFSGEATGDLTGNLISAAKNAGIKVSEIMGNDTIVVSSLIRLDILFPERERAAPVAAPNDVNSYSLIMLASLADHKMLLTADCTQEVEAELLDDGKWPQADILKVAHHGSRFASSAEFLRQVSPAAAIISVGSNVYGHPTADTLNRLENTGSRILRTDRQGAVRIDIRPTFWAMAAICP